MRITWRERLQREPHWSDIKNWPTVDVLLGVPQKDRKAFNRNLSLIARVLTGTPQKQLATEFGISPGRVSQLLQRALGGDDQDPPLLTQGLIPNQRLKPVTRRAPLSTYARKRGARGAFSHLLTVCPDLKVYLDRLIKGCVKRLRRGQNLNPQTFHQAFIRFLRTHGWPMDTYPFTEVSLGYQSTRRYLNAQVQLLLLPKPTRRIIFPTQSSMRIGSEVEIDEHTAHLHGRVSIVFNDELEPLRLSRVSLLLARDVATQCRLAYTVALTGYPGKEDVLELLEKINTPWSPLNIKTPGLVYLPGAGFPSGLSEASRRVTLGIVRFDNALAHKAHSVRSLILRYYGATVNLGLVRTPKARNLIEQAFKQLNQNIHRFPSTSGSHPQDPCAEPAKHKKKVPVIPLQALEESIEVLLANENASPQPQLGGQSALSAWRYQLENLLIPLRPIIPDHVFQPFMVRTMVTVRKPKKERRNPYITFERVRYTGDGINRAELINQRVLIEYDLRDIRSLRVLTPQGVRLGAVFASRSWQRFKHGIKTRKLINKLIREERIRGDDPLGRYFDYLLVHRDIPTEALKLVKLYREYELQVTWAEPPDQVNQTRAVASPNTGIPEWHSSMVRRRKTP